VLEGVVSDDTGGHLTHYPAGTYLRNPEGFRHAPFSKQGCTIFVKLHQFQDADRRRVCIDTSIEPWRSGHGNLEVMSLHSHGSESVALVHWPAGEVFREHSHFGVEESYVIGGEFIDEYGRYPAGTWIRCRHLSKHHPLVEVDTLVWVKAGHLPAQ
jgi:anti-sigma factor ChrR (cupin superfamily)